MQNFDDLDIEGRNPSHLSEEDKEKVNRGCGTETNCHELLSIVYIVVANKQQSNTTCRISESSSNNLLYTSVLQIFNIPFFKNDLWIVTTYGYF